MTYMSSNKTKRKSIPFQTEIRKARQLSFRILLFLLQSLDGIGSFDGNAHGHALGLHVWALHITNLLARCPRET